MKDSNFVQRILGEDDSPAEVTVAEAIAYLDGSLPEADYQEFEAYMSACPEVQALVEVVKRERELERIESDRLDANDRATETTAQSSRGFSFRWLSWIGAALPVGGLAVALILLAQSNDQLGDLKNTLDISLSTSDKLRSDYVAQNGELSEKDTKIASLQKELEASKAAQSEKPSTGTITNGKPTVRSNPGQQARPAIGTTVFKSLRALSALLASGAIRGEDPDPAIKIDSLSAHRTYVAPGPVTLKWTEDPAVTKWHVYVSERQSGMSIWPAPGTLPEETTNCKVLLPEGTLEPGKAYVWSVANAETGSMGPSWSFAVLSTKAMAALKTRIGRNAKDSERIEAYVDFLLLDLAEDSIRSAKAYSEDERSRLLRFVDALRLSVSK